MAISLLIKSVELPLLPSFLAKLNLAETIWLPWVNKSFIVSPVEVPSKLRILEVGKIVADTSLVVSVAPYVFVNTSLLSKYKS